MEHERAVFLGPSQADHWLCDKRRVSPWRGVRFGVSASCAVKLVQRFERTGSVSPGKRGGSVGKLAAHKGFLLGQVAAKRDITMPELAAALEAETGTKAAPASLSRLLIRHGLRFKKHCGPPNRAAPT